MRYRRYNPLNPLYGFAQATTPKPPKEEFHIVVNGQQAGPMTEAELKVLVKNGTVTADTMVWTPQLVQWTPAQMVPTVNKLLLMARKPEKVKTVPPPPSAQAPRQTENPIRKDMISAVSMLGLSKSAAAEATDRVLAANPDISLKDGIKEVLKSMR